ncbi:MAG: hypothetical protein IT265_16270 [Saprospiraceae bacterium]|nr:hypothetical protein [Saprospiraceae bacterium]
MKLVKRFGLFLFFSFLLFIIYANMESRPLHAKVPEVDWLIVDIECNLELKDKMNIEKKYASVYGISTCVLNSDHNRMSFSFFKSQTKKENIINMLNADGLNPKIPSFNNMVASSPQCPVPMSWILNFEKFKYAFNFR